MGNAIELLKQEWQSTADLQHAHRRSAAILQKSKDSKHSTSTEPYLPVPGREALEHFPEVTNSRGGQLTASSQLMGVMRTGAMGFISWPPGQDGLSV